MSFYTISPSDFISREDKAITEMPERNAIKDAAKNRENSVFFTKNEILM